MQDAIFFALVLLLIIITSKQPSNQPHIIILKYDDIVEKDDTDITDDIKKDTQ